MHHIFFIHSSVSGHLGCFHVLAIVSSANRNKNVSCLEHLHMNPISRSWMKGGRKVQFSSVAQSCLTLCDPMDCSTPGLPVCHHPPEFTQTHVYRVRDAIQPSHPLSSPSPPALNLSQYQGMSQFQRVSSLHQMAKILVFQLQHQSFQWWGFIICVLRSKYDFRFQERWIQCPITWYRHGLLCSFQKTVWWQRCQKKEWERIIGKIC